jgi:hypothetical protein
VNWLDIMWGGLNRIDDLDVLDTLLDAREHWTPELARSLFEPDAVISIRALPVPRKPRALPGRQWGDP